jgi:hypothetical protein
METEKSRIILLSDVKEQRERQLKELAMYLKKKEELETKLEYIRRDLQLTETIIKMIQSENSANSVSIRS